MKRTRVSERVRKCMYKKTRASIVRGPALMKAKAPTVTCLGGGVGRWCVCVVGIRRGQRNHCLLALIVCEGSEMGAVFFDTNSHRTGTVATVLQSTDGRKLPASKPLHAFLMGREKRHQESACLTDTFFFLRGLASTCAKVRRSGIGLIG